MTLGTRPLKKRRNGGARQLAAAAAEEVSAFYAVMARLLIGRFEDFSDFEAARRQRRLNRAARQPVAITVTARRGR